MTGFLQVPPKSSFKKLLLGTGLWLHAKMSTSLKSLDGLKDPECKKGQLSRRLPVLYLPVVDIVTPKEEPQHFKVKLLDTTHLNMPIYSHGNNEEYLAHIDALLRVIKQKVLLKKCKMLAKAVVRWSEALKNLHKPHFIEKTSQQALMLRPARWRLSIPNRCSKNPRRLTMTRQLLRHTSS
jgi:hypothetical protein